MYNETVLNGSTRVGIMSRCLHMIVLLKSLKFSSFLELARLDSEDGVASIGRLPVGVRPRQYSLPVRVFVSY